MRCVCVFALNCIMFFFLFGVKCIECIGGTIPPHIGKEQWSSEEPMRRYGQTS